MNYQSPRIVLRHEDPRNATIDLFSRKLGLGEARRLDNAEASTVQLEIVWRVNESTEVHYLEDSASGAGFIVTTGSDREDVAEWAGMVSSYIGAWNTDELLSAVSDAADAEVRSHLILLAALSAPDEFDERVFEAISAGLNSADPQVRMSAVWACTYPGWTEFSEKLRKLAESDGERDIRETAMSIVDIMEKGHP